VRILLVVPKTMRSSVRSLIPSLLTLLVILPLVQANSVVSVIRAIANHAKKRRSKYLIDLFMDLLAENITGFLTAKSSHNVGFM
jgi:hypothetical protein